jgi:hypothetical protein
MHLYSTSHYLLGLIICDYYNPVSLMPFFFIGAKIWTNLNFGILSTKVSVSGQYPLNFQPKPKIPN